jgi:hypothetical protein
LALAKHAKYATPSHHANPGGSSHEMRSELSKYIVYKSRNRQTGTLTTMHDTKHPDNKFPIIEERYVVTCTEHETVARFAKHLDAGAALANPGQWCKACRDHRRRRDAV